MRQKSIWLHFLTLHCIDFQSSIADSQYGDVSGLPDPFHQDGVDSSGVVKTNTQQSQSQHPMQHMTFEESLGESGYSTPNSRNRRIIREIIVWFPFLLHQQSCDLYNCIVKHHSSLTLQHSVKSTFLCNSWQNNENSFWYYPLIIMHYFSYSYEVIGHFSIIIILFIQPNGR